MPQTGGALKAQRSLHRKRDCEMIFFLHPFIPIGGFACILWTEASAEQVQTLTPNKGKDRQTHT